MDIKKLFDENEKLKEANELMRTALQDARDHVNQLQWEIQDLKTWVMTPDKPVKKYRSIDDV